MKCPYCSNPDTKVIDSRPAEDGNSIRRRRACDECGKRFTTYEKVETIPLIIIKKDNNREQYDRAKIEAGILRACYKRPVSAEAIQRTIEAIETEIFKREEKEISSNLIGEIVMEKLKNLDPVAYVRFASVYREFKDVNTFVAELKKILEIEGLLDKYGHLVNDDETDRRQGYPRNNYSGLNSLRARLKNRHWDGISPLDSASIGYGNNGDDAEKPGIIVSERTELIQAGNCIGSPVYFFFNLNTAHLTDASQMLNLDELARVAKKYGLSLRVTGAADSSTGTPVLNGSLSTSRADYIVAELKKRGIPIERIVKVSRGGIADHVPVEVNRHTKVELFF